MKHNPPTNPAKIGSGYGAVYLTIQANCLDQADYEEVAQTLAADIRSNRNKKENTK